MLIEDLQDVAVVEVFLAALGVTRIEEARVDALDFDRDGANRAFAGRHRVSGHAGNAQWSVPV